MEKKKNCSQTGSADHFENGKKLFVKPTLTKYGTVKDVYSGPSCKAAMAKDADK